MLQSPVSLWDSELGWWHGSLHIQEPCQFPLSQFDTSDLSWHRCCMCYLILRQSTTPMLVWFLQETTRLSRETCIRIERLSLIRIDLIRIILKRYNMRWDVGMIVAGRGGVGYITNTNIIIYLCMCVSIFLIYYTIYLLHSSTVTHSRQCL